MAITLEAQGLAASNRFKLDDKKLKNTPVTPFKVPLKVPTGVQGAPSAQPPVTPASPQPAAQVAIPAVQAPVATAPVQTPAKPESKPEPKTEARPPETAIQKTLRQMEESYQNLKDSINLKKLDPQKIDDLIAKAEKRTGLPYSDVEKAQFREWVKSNNPELLKMVALELRVGISEKAEKEAMAALGRLILYRNNMKDLKLFLADPEKDPNLKAYVRTVLMMQKVEGVMSTVEGLKRKVKKSINPLNYLVPPVASNN
jgi:hypothetical protein